MKGTKKNIVTRDTALTEEEEKILNEAHEALRNGKTKTLNEVLRARV
ncbi:MAG: hypothetical protein LUQ71_10265 [Methanoregula sp.]|nr:hypothetical protein [Methanoregula sp.]